MRYKPIRELELTSEYLCDELFSRLDEQQVWKSLTGQSSKPDASTLRKHLGSLSLAFSLLLELESFMSPQEAADFVSYGQVGNQLPLQMVFTDGEEGYSRIISAAAG